jgi:Uma2 family endonuclease
MPTQLLLTVEEYLETSFADSDREYADGELLKYTWGEIDHGNIQGLIYGWFFARRKQLGVYPLVEVRTRVSPTRYRVPDITIVRGGKPSGRVIIEPAPLVIEILSPEDRASRMEAKIDDYLRLGIGNVWVVDPQTGHGHIYTAERRIVVDDGRFRIADPLIEMEFSELLSE